MTKHRLDWPQRSLSEQNGKRINPFAKAKVKNFVQILAIWRPIYYLAALGLSAYRYM
jgi:hypothetical protein